MRNSFGFYLFFSALSATTAFANEPVIATDIMNNGNFSARDADGVPLNWRCFCKGALTPCLVEDNPDLPSDLLVNSGCSVAQDIALSNQTEEAYEQLEAKGNSNPRDFRLIALNTKNEIEPGQLGATDSDGWTTIYSSPLSSATTRVSNGKALIKFLFVNTTLNPIRIRNVHVFQGGNNPPPKSATLLHAVQDTRYAFKASSGSSPNVLWFPLPLDYATQIPLSIKLTAVPSPAVQSIIYSRDIYGNSGATVTLAPSSNGGIVTIHWDAIVLARSIDDSERAAIYQATEDPGLWLESTPMVDANFSGIQELAKTFSTPSDGRLVTLRDILNWTSNKTNMRYAMPAQSFTATDAFLSRQTTCTGFANLGAALGRALGIPSRSMANILVGEAQDTHWIDEFYLGKELGWRRVEPQAAALSVPEDYGVMLRKDLPRGDEDSNYPLPALPGIPRFALPGVISGNVFRISDDYFGNNNSQMTFAEVQATLRGDPNTMRDAFDLARVSWQRDFGRADAMYREDANSLRTSENLDLWVRSTANP